MNIEIRRADINNLADIKDLNNKLFELEYKNFDSSLRVGWSYGEKADKYFKDVLNRKSVFIALDNNKIIGYLAGSIHIEKSYRTKTLAEIDNMFILEEYRKNGVGTALINEFKNYCNSNEIEEIIVSANINNINALDFYRKNGFDNFEITLKFN